MGLWEMCPRGRGENGFCPPLCFLAISAAEPIPLDPLDHLSPRFLLRPDPSSLTLASLVLCQQLPLSVDPSLTHSHHLLSPTGLRVSPGVPPCLFPFLIGASPGRYTYEIAPVFVLMEEEVLKTLRALVGWSSGDGVFCPGT